MTKIDESVKKGINIKVFRFLNYSSIMQLLNYEGYIVFDTDMPYKIENLRIFLNLVNLKLDFEIWGFPDLFCYKSNEDYKFIELKKIPDNIQISQLIFNDNNKNVEFWFYVLGDSVLPPSYLPYLQNHGF